MGAEVARMRMPTTREIHKKIRLSFDLFAAAFEIKRHQLRKKHPDLPERELTRRTMELIERGLR